MPRVTGPIETSAPSDTYPTHDSQFGLGGLREVETHVQRNFIPNDRRRNGMLVFTAVDQAYWMLRPAPWTGTDLDWVPANLGGPAEVVDTGPYVHHQRQTADTWTVLHGLGYDPIIDVIRDDGVRILGFDLTHADDQMSSTLRFSQAIAGRALLAN